MKHCEVISGFYVDEEVDGEVKSVPKCPKDKVDLPDDVADAFFLQGLVDIISHDGQPVGYGACCGGH